MSIDERAVALTEIAHPDFREALEREFADLGVRFDEARAMRGA